jgi:GTP-binding protein
VKISDVKLVISAVRKSQFPNDDKPEFLLVGRSNVGKSSFINTLINRKNFARTSSIPGKTQTLNYYLINDSFYFVDAPGYGYAKVSRQLKNKFGLIMEDYLEGRDDLKLVFMLVDFRHKPTQDDITMYKYLKHYNIKTQIICTKLDKVTMKNKDKNLKLIAKTFEVDPNELILFSTITKYGRDETFKVIESNIA